MQLKYNYWYFTKAIKKEVCDEIISVCLKNKQERGVLRDSTKEKTNINYQYQYRDCKIAWISSKWIYGILNPFIHSANKKAGWNFQWDWNEPSQFTIYNKNQFYKWHTDQGPKLLTTRNKNIKGKQRKLSLTLQLTEPSEYEGGDFQFKWFDGKKMKTDTPKNAKELGTIIIFPSFTPHQVTPITKGTRQSLVNWSIGKPFI
jgi:hypothetical protein